MDATMTKKKPTTRAKPAAERKTIAVTIKGDPEWKEWLEDLAGHCRDDVAKVIDKALVEYAKMKGYDREAPRR
jgi:hypothetical protein